MARSFVLLSALVIFSGCSREPNPFADIREAYHSCTDKVSIMRAEALVNRTVPPEQLAQFELEMLNAAGACLRAAEELCYQAGGDESCMD